jgi:hypothetical protein
MATAQMSLHDIKARPCFQTEPPSLAGQFCLSQVYLLSYLPHFWVKPLFEKTLLLQAASQEIPPLRADDLLIDRLLQTVEMRLCAA